MGDASFSTQLIDGDGVVNVSGLDHFMKEVKLGECGLSYAVVSIMGPQSTGKSTLLNHLFGTNFREMDAFKGRSQTTKGIWLAKAQNIEPCTIMDLEGTDGRERGELVNPAYQSLLGHLRTRIVEEFKESLDRALTKEGFAIAARDCTQTFLEKFDKGSEDAAIQQVKWDPSKVKDKLKRDIEAHVASVRAAKLSELCAKYEAQLTKALAEPVEALLDSASEDTWPDIRKLLQCETKAAISGLESALSAFELDEATEKELLVKLENHGRSVVESKAKEEAGRVLIRMKDRFSTLFSRDADSMPRVWTGKEDIKAITKTARSASMKLLATLAAIRLDEDGDNIENVLSLALVDTSRPGTTDRSIKSFDPLASSSWEKVPEEKTIISPVQCKSLWRQFKAETEYTVTQAIAAQEANKRNNWLPPPWALAAMAILGFNEFMTLLRNPLYLAVIFVVFLVGKAFWVQLDIATEFQNGFLPAILSLSTKFVPTIMNILKRLAEGQRPAASDRQRETELQPTDRSSYSSVTSAGSSSITATESGPECSSPVAK